MKSEERDHNIFNRCATMRIEINEMIERSDELLEKTREIMGLSIEEWNELMSTARNRKKAKLIETYANKKD